MSVPKNLAHRLFALSLIILSSASILAAAKATADYDELMKSGSEKEIAAAFKKDGDMRRAKIGSEEDSLIMRAVKYGRPEGVIALLLKAGVSVSAKNKDGQTALMYACIYSQDSAVIQLLLKKSGSKRSIRQKLLQKDSFGKSALDYARLNPSSAAIALIGPYLSEEDLAASAPDSESAEPPLDSSEAEDGVPPQQETSSEIQGEGAAVQNDEQTEEEARGADSVQQRESDFDRIMKFGANADAGGYQKIYLYDYAPKEEESLPPDSESPGVPLASIENPDQADSLGRTRLMQAARAGNDWEIRSLLHSGANANRADNDGWTPLMYAVRYQNNAAVVDILLDNGAKINASNKYGATPLQLAAAYTENPEILKRILEEYQSGSSDVFKAFIMTVSTGGQNVPTQLEKIRLFLAKNVLVNRFYDGRTPLMYAAEFCSSTKVIKLLLDSGATPSIRAADGRRAFEYAAANTHLAHDETYWALNVR